MLALVRYRFLALLACLGCLHLAAAQTTYESNGQEFVSYVQPDGTTVFLADNRRPSLYTGNFGDCMGGSAINVTRFDAAYYQDNMTVLFHLAGNSGLDNASVVVFIGVYAYGQNRFDLTFNPCSANINSLCPVNSSVPIVASGIIPVSQSDVSGIPPIALSIPDFEGQAILRIFSNTTQSEIACYSAVVTNGNTFSQPAAVGSVLGAFTVIALLASFATAAFGEAIPTMRLHYAHSLSVGVVFAVFQHIFFTGALSMNWPSVLVAWWSNFAWAGGMIFSSSMQSSIDKLIGTNVGNTSEVGAAGSGSSQTGLGGGFDLSLIYKRAVSWTARRAGHPITRDIASEIYGRPDHSMLKRDVLRRSLEHTIERRALANSSTGYDWYGHVVGDGLPLPGNYSGFAGTLAEEGIRASNAFMTGFLWFLILLVLLVAALVAFKWSLEGLVRVKALKQDRLKFFRDHWLRYSAALALRICYIAFFMLMFLTIFQFTYQSSGGVKGVAAIVFIIFLVGTSGIATYAFLEKKRRDRTGTRPSRAQVERKTLLGRLPWFGAKTGGSTGDEMGPQEQPLESRSSGKQFLGDESTPPISNDTEAGVRNIHDDEEYTMRFGWLAARFRRTRWWFFLAWIFYEFVRAIFYGGAAGSPLAQVFGLLAVEVIAFAFLVWARPFEGRRLNAIVVYCLGFSKVASVGLSAAFAIQFNLQRITTTVIGIVIIVIQGILTIITLIAIIVGAVSSYMSVSRNHENFRPRKLAGMREKYFNHLDRVLADVPRPPKVKAVPESEEPKEPYFEMRNVRRMAKIEDDDDDADLNDPNASHVSVNQAPTPSRPGSLLEGYNRSGAATPVRRGRAESRAQSIASASQTNLPFGARANRPSWNTLDFQEFKRTFSATDPNHAVAGEEPHSPISASASAVNIPRTKTPLRSATLPNAALRPQASNDEFRVGGDVSSPNTIGMVPSPSVRPRSGTFGSRPTSRISMSSYVQNGEASKSGDALGDLLAIQSDAQYMPRRQPLTPAQEMEEFTLPPKLPNSQ